MGEAIGFEVPHPVRMGPVVLASIAKVKMPCKGYLRSLSHHLPEPSAKHLSALISGSLGSKIGPE